MGTPGSFGTFTSIATLRANTFAPSSPYDIFLEGYTSIRDGGEGVFTYVSTDTTSADDAGSIIVDVGGRRWYRQGITDTINVRWFGATGNGSTDDTVALQNAINAAIYLYKVPRIFVPAGNYKTSDVLNIGYGFGFGSYDTYTTCYFEGAQYNYAGTIGGTCFTPTFSDRPCIAVQGGRGVVLKNFSMVGKARSFIVSNGLGSGTTTVNDFLPTQWIDPTLNANANSQYAPLRVG
jgi:Pectate lyase superfamily protein